MRIITPDQNELRKRTLSVGGNRCDMERHAQCNMPRASSLFCTRVSNTTGSDMDEINEEINDKPKQTDIDTVHIVSCSII